MWLVNAMCGACMLVCTSKLCLRGVDGIVCGMDSGMYPHIVTGTQHTLLVHANVHSTQACSAVDSSLQATMRTILVSLSTTTRMAVTVLIILQQLDAGARAAAQAIICSRVVLNEICVSCVQQLDAGAAVARGSPLLLRMLASLCLVNATHLPIAHIAP